MLKKMISVLLSPKVNTVISKTNADKPAAAKVADINTLLNS